MWVGEVCAADEPLDAVSVQATLVPEFASGEPAETDRPAVIAFITRLHDAYVKAGKAYDAIGPALFPRGDELVAQHRRGLAEIVPRMQGHLERARVGPAQELGPVVELAATQASAWSPAGPGLSELRRTVPGLEEAFHQAPECTT